MSSKCTALRGHTPAAAEEVFSSPEKPEPAPPHLPESLGHLLPLPQVLAEVAVILSIRAVVVCVAESALLGVKGQAVGKCFSFLLAQRGLAFLHTFLRLKCDIFLQKGREGEGSAGYTGVQGRTRDTG